MRQTVFIITFILGSCYSTNSLSQAVKVNADSSALFANQSNNFIPDYQKTNFINKEDSPEGFPFLSGDGLRLYFTSNRGNGDRLHFSSRKTINDKFGEPGILSKNIKPGFVNGTLTNDELTICMSYKGQIYLSKRASLHNEFSEPVLIRLKEQFTSPSISPDGNEIIVMISGYGSPRILKKVCDFEYAEAGYNPLPGFWGNDKGQYSKDGLAFYISRANHERNDTWLYTRKSVKDRFIKTKEFNIQKEGIKSILNPSINSDGTIVICTINNAEPRYWQQSDLLLFNFQVNRN